MVTLPLAQMTFADIAVTDLIFRLRDPEDDQMTSLGTEQDRKDMLERWVGD